MKRVVADTNILVSALQFGGKPKQILDLAVDGQIELAVSEAIIAEALRVLRDKFERTPEWLVEADRQIRVVARLVEPTESITAIDSLSDFFWPVSELTGFRDFQIVSVFLDSVACPKLFENLANRAPW